MNKGQLHILLILCFLASFFWYESIIRVYTHPEELASSANNSV